MRYQFLIDTYETEILKVLSVWAMFEDGDLRRRPHPSDPRGRNLLEHMIHQCAGENMWFSKMLGITVTENPLPAEETRLTFMQHYAADAALRLAVLRERDEAWWEKETDFFTTRRTCAWIMTRRIAHTAYHRGQQTALLRMIGKPIYSTYGPTADTGGLPRDDAPTIYLYENQELLLAGESVNQQNKSLPTTPEQPVTERPEAK